MTVGLVFFLRAGSKDRNHCSVGVHLTRPGAGRARRSHQSVAETTGLAWLEDRDPERAALLALLRPGSPPACPWPLLGCR